MGYASGEIPNPQNSPIEKVEAASMQTPTELAAQFARELRISGAFEDDQINALERAIFRMTEQKQLDEEEVRRQIEYWANIHTHPVPVTPMLGTGDMYIAMGGNTDMFAYNVETGEYTPMQSTPISSGVLWGDGDQSSSSRLFIYNNSTAYQNAYQNAFSVPGDDWVDFETGPGLTGVTVSNNAHCSGRALPSSDPGALGIIGKDGSDALLRYWNPGDSQWDEYDLFSFDTFISAAAEAFEPSTYALALRDNGEVYFVDTDFGGSSFFLSSPISGTHTIATFGNGTKHMVAVASDTEIAILDQDTFSWDGPFEVPHGDGIANLTFDNSGQLLLMFGGNGVSTDAVHIMSVEGTWGSGTPMPSAKNGASVMPGYPITLA